MKSKIFIFWLVVFGALFAFLQVGFKYYFFYIEQSQLFQFSWPYITDRIFSPGGAVLLVSEFLVQFFILPFAGPGIVAALLTLAGFCTGRIVKQIAPSSDPLLWALLPVTTLLFLHFDFNYLVAGTVAYDCMLLLLWGYVAVQNSKTRLIIALIGSPLLFVVAGPVALLFAGAVSLYELFNRTSGGYRSLLAIAEVLLLGVCSVYFSWSGEYRFVFLPDVYYHPSLQPKPVIYFAWIGLLLVIAVAFLLKKRVALPGKKRRVGEALLQIGVIGVLFGWGLPKYSDAKSAKLKELDYYARSAQWDKIIDSCHGKLTNFLYMCYLNRALVEKGAFTERMFEFDQRGPQGLLVSWNKSEQISSLLSDIYFTMSYIGSSQQMAFEAYVSSLGAGNPRMLQRLVQTNLIYGAYPVAEKYIRILENTFYYRKWATSHRPFLYRDDLVEAEPVLGPKRKSLPAENNLSGIDGINADLQKLAETNPRNTAPIQYLGAFYLLSKDLKGFKEMVEKNFGTEVLSTLPVYYQEALIVLSEKDPDYWRKYGISEDIVNRFTEYKKQVLAHKGNPSALPGLLRRAYGNTYWYYFMFK